jgi:hypothetical protein
MTTQKGDRVIFRVDREGNVFALLLDPAGARAPTEPPRGWVTIFTSHGHTEGPYIPNIDNSRPAKLKEYLALARLMRTYGYKPIVMQRRPRTVRP